MPDQTSPCPLCGYQAPELPCPHCAGTATDPSLRRPLRGPLFGVIDGFQALPRGLVLLFRTPGTKRWLAPPLLLTSLLLTLVLWWSVSSVNGLLDQVLPQGIVLDGEWGWLERLGENWGWLQATWAWLVGAVEWTLNLGWDAFLSWRWLGWFLLGSLVMWYCFSIAYEALAGPFLDEIQARIEGKWFGFDPRSRLERPNDIPVERCMALGTLTFVVGVLASWALWVPLGPWGLLVAVPLAFVPAGFLDGRFLAWARWVASVEGRATWASLQATLLTAVLLVFALPLYFVPFAGYFLFAGVCGFATAVGLLDIPFERRGWPLAARARFILRNILPFLAFGVFAGLLLAVPIVGPILMVPAASIGGLWLICRLDKSGLR